MFGGLSRQLFNDISYIRELPFANSGEDQRFKWFDVNYNDNDVVPYERFGHIAAQFDKDIIIFGGARMYNKSSKVRECLGDIAIFHTDTLLWEEVKASPGTIIYQRHNHVGCIIGQHLLIHGGINEQNLYYDDIILTNLSAVYKTNQLTN